MAGNVNLFVAFDKRVKVLDKNSETIIISIYYLEIFVGCFVDARLHVINSMREGEVDGGALLLFYY